MARMLYKYPSKYTVISEGKGFVKVDGIKFDYAIVNEDSIKKGLPRGWHLTPADAKAPKKVTPPTED